MSLDKYILRNIFGFQYPYHGITDLLQVGSCLSFSFTSILQKICSLVIHTDFLHTTESTVSHLYVLHMISSKQNVPLSYLQS